MYQNVPIIDLRIIIFVQSPENTKLTYETVNVINRSILAAVNLRDVKHEPSILQCKKFLRCLKICVHVMESGIGHFAPCIIAMHFVRFICGVDQ